MKKLILLLFTVLTLQNFTAQAQAVRYLDTVFTTIRVDSNVVYGVNYTINGIILQQTTRTLRQPLTANVHQPPANDPVALRPLVLVFHSGNFLSQVLSRGYTGRKEDSIVSTLCAQFAHRGYVAASCTYRFGWNPFDPNQDNRTSFLINAAYRGIQDARTAIRFFKANAATYKIDTTKIILVGSGTGGYITLGTAAFDRYSKVATTQFPANKFINSATGIPMVVEQVPNFGFIMGDVEAKNLGRVPPPGGTPPALDTLCFPNHVANTSNFQLCVNLGGAVGDLNWIDANTPPIISFQTPYDQNAPYTDETLRVPSPAGALPVVRVQGAFLIQKRLDSIGNNNAMKGNIVPKYNPFKAVFDARKGANNFTGLFPMIGKDTISDSSPWDFVGPNDPFAASILTGAPAASRARGLRYIDTIMKVITPRACLVLNLPCKGVVNGTEDLLNAETTKLTLAPNPAQNMVTFESDVFNPIQAIEVYDMAGRLVHQVAKINNHQYQLQRGNLPVGMYLAKVKFEGGVLSKKLVFEDR
jgi:hypothetical protein